LRRSLEEIYAVLYIDGIRYKVRDNGVIKSKTVYGVVGIDLEGRKDVLGLWISETENAKYWLSVLTDLKNRGVKDVLIITSDDLPGIQEAISAVYPDSQYQGCVVHVIRNSLKYVSYKDRKAFIRTMKGI
jgi:putative transposase